MRSKYHPFHCITDVFIFAINCSVMTKLFDNLPFVFTVPKLGQKKEQFIFLTINENIIS